MSEHECVCGFESDSPQGIAAHQRHCEEHQSDDSPDSVEDAATVSTAEAEPVGPDGPLVGEEDYDFEGVEADAFERDDEECVSCGSVSGLTIHRYREGSDALTNLVTLCEECDEALTGLHYRTKRGEVNR